jgi:hypothetical protein
MLSEQLEFPDTFLTDLTEILDLRWARTSPCKNQDSRTTSGIHQMCPQAPVI